MAMFPSGNEVLRFQNGRLSLTVVERDAASGWRPSSPSRSGGCLSEFRLDPSHDVRFAQKTLRLQQLGDFQRGAVDDRIGDCGAEKATFELSSFLELLRPFAARRGESEVGARRHIPGRLEYRGDLGHEPRLQYRDRVRFRSRPARHILQQASLLGGEGRSLRPGRAKLIPRCNFGGSAPNRFVLPNNFMNDKGQELLGKVWVKFADRREMPQTTELLGFSAGIARGQSVLSLQFSHRAGTPEPLRQQVDDRGIDIVDAVPQVAKFGNGIGRIHHYTFSFLSSFCHGVSDVEGKTL
jgi:hypothetical protein